ncbi:hypothetical protein MKK69_04555 [Methylobacterium sp. J-026]|uniref:hypothetical protein n=1 Tax=Methylobacterium sp. J-026 TaxID=2836624 RepID=UPI001FB98DC7|nr:hypothetical protein [Methylobacterium sp. J-026]MCJ2133339.1 hypothetical protein [Methylobacterium sp. J-026]
MTQDDPFARLEAGLTQPKPQKAEPPDDQQIVARIEEGFAALFDAIRKFDTVLSRHGDWNVRFAWLNVDSNRIAYGLINIFKGGHVVQKMPLSFQGKGVWFEDPEFVKMAQRQKEKGSWHTSEISQLVDALSTYIQHIVQERG